jgi:ABC-type phosphate/phosphonate transport system substrate-binding protein
VNRAARPPAAAWVVPLLAAGALAASASAGEKKKPDEQPVRYAFTKGIFAHVDARDAKVAMEVWLQKLIDKDGQPRRYRFHATTFADEASLVKAVRKGRLHLVALTAKRYLELRDELKLEPAPLPVIDRAACHPYVLLVHANSGITRLEQLKGKRLVAETGSRNNSPLTWLETLLLEGGGSDPSKFFSRIRKASKPSGIALPVFFRQADACLISRPAFKLLVELNPQLGKKLKPLSTSPPLVRVVVSYTRACDAETRKAISEFMLGLHKSTEGKQVLTLFRTDKLVPYDPKHLAGTVKLFKRLEALKKRKDKSPKDEPKDRPPSGKEPAPGKRAAVKGGAG